MLTKANQSSQHQLDAKVRALLSPTVKTIQISCASVPKGSTFSLLHLAYLS